MTKGWSNRLIERGVKRARREQFSKKKEKSRFTKGIRE